MCCDERVGNLPAKITSNPSMRYLRIKLSLLGAMWGRENLIKIPRWRSQGWQGSHKTPMLFLRPVLLVDMFVRDFIPKIIISFTIYFIFTSYNLLTKSFPTTTFPKGECKCELSVCGDFLTIWMALAGPVHRLRNWSSFLPNINNEKSKLHIPTIVGGLSHRWQLP